MALSGLGLGLATAGGVVLWAGLAGASPLAIVKTIASGKAPPAPDVNGLLSDLAQQISGTMAQGLSDVGGSILGGG